MVTASFSSLKLCGLFDANGDLWSKRRTIVAPAFTKIFLRKLYDVVLECCNKQIDTWKTQGNASAFRKSIFEFTLNIVFVVSFGTEIPKTHSLHLYRVFEALHRRAESIFPFHLLYLSKKDKEYFETRNALELFAREQINDFQKKANAKPSILTGILESGINQTELIEMVMQMWLAAYHTTASTLSIIFYLLGKHPEYQNRIREEALKHKALTYDVLLELVEVKNFILEAMRRYPITQYLFSQTKAPMILEGKTVPAKTIVVMYTATHLINLFPNGEKFDPMRWNSQDMTTPEIKFLSSLPFGGGKRVCVGMNLALMEMMCLTSLACIHYHITIPPGFEVDLDDTVCAFVVEPRNPLSVELLPIGTKLFS